VLPAQIHWLTITHEKTMRLKSSKLKNKGMSVQIKSNHNEMIITFSGFELKNSNQYKT
jgi:hypothetical protein